MLNHTVNEIHFLVLSTKSIISVELLVDHPSTFINQTGIKHCRGILLHGPPGSGETLLARTICQALNVKPKVVNGSEIFSKMLGESEEKMRELFADAEFDTQEVGVTGALYIIIFDEIDALCKKRSSTNSSTRDAVQNNITSRLLTKLDGFAQLNNVLVIGRLETLIKVELPTENDRLKIFDIYTKSMLQNHLLDNDIDIKQILFGKHGLTGAHIEKLVRLTVNNALRRDVIERGTLDIGEDSAEQLRICNSDFSIALEKVQLKPLDFFKGETNDM
ncbi:unnamed protein product [Didymodactylos carnosus]|uniref:Vesicle-fusing ATPase n=1 Tax=Didymodactylos carnosus TaxID=1234261 RepID=A0A815E3Q1_9BILA|nr:unnamed protein product [Didymodactylos carnosus]CAF1306051.1 unnamed protein product [Didymodactylos carnosus]CAF4075587.1 unnamed protein product [Didymodactylos carnosus]CAF4139585.1 unnamed protein product [Didymodactylos carnosus]